MNIPKKKSETELLDTLLEAEIDALLTASDDAILSEASDIHADPTAAASRLRSLVDGAVTAAGKRRLAEARTALDAAPKSPSNVLQLPLVDKRKLIDRLRENTKGLTMAARQGERESERDLDSLLEDLIDIGAIDEEGNLL